MVQSRRNLRGTRIRVPASVVQLEGGLDDGVVV